MVQKRSGRLEPFSSAKLAVGLGSALADRPVSGAAAENLARDVERAVQNPGGQVSSEEIGREVLSRLRELDEVAYLRFASVYKEFQDAADFEREVAALESAD
jgi:transcriptional repressor NrdR